MGIRGWRLSAGRDSLIKMSSLRLGIFALISCALVGATRVEAQAPLSPQLSIPLAMPHVPDLPPEPPGPPQLSVAKDRPLAEQPFWKSKPGSRKRLYEDRAVLVSVRDERIKVLGREQVRFTVKGAGLVSAPKKFAFATAREYDKLKTVSGHFKTVEFHAPTRKLFLVMEALGYQARMVLRMRPVSEDWRDELQWDVIWGDFKGMTGVIAFESTEKTGRTEVSIEAKYESEKLPLPKIVMGLALEAIAQKVAEKMRTFIEREYRAANVPNTKDTIASEQGSKSK